MATDRTLPRRFERLSSDRGTPVPAIKLTGLTVAFLLVAVPDVAAAGAMSGLIFLLSFGLAHGIAYLVRKRVGGGSPFQTPAFPLIPAVGGITCLALGLFQALAVPSAGALAALWLSLGAVLYVSQLAPRARSVDASSEALDPELMRLRGRSPLMLVPIANPASAETLVTMADALAPPSVSRVMLLSVVAPPGEWPEGRLPPQLADAQAILGGALSAALSGHLRPEALITVSDDPWGEIERVAKRSRCESLLVGVGQHGQALLAGPLEGLLERVDADVVVLRAPSNWKLEQARGILVPSGGGRDQSPTRARLLGNLCRAGAREVTFLRVLPESTDAETARRAERELRRLASDEAPGVNNAVLALRDDVVAEVRERAADSDLVILGLKRVGRRRQVFGERVLDIAQNIPGPLLMISQRS
jgi:hypothetical protein